MFAYEPEDSEFLKNASRFCCCLFHLTDLVQSDIRICQFLPKTRFVFKVYFDRSQFIIKAVHFAKMIQFNDINQVEIISLPY